MSFRADTTLSPDILFITLDGDWPSLQEQRALRADLQDRGHLTEATRALIDIRNADVPPYGEAEKIVAAALKDGALPHTRAYLVGSAVQFGFVRQFQSCSPSHIIIEIFTNEREAWLWLGRRNPTISKRKIPRR